MKVDSGVEIVSFAKVLDEDDASKPVTKKEKAENEQMTLV